MCRAIYNNTYIIGFGNYNGSITAAENNLNKKYLILIILLKILLKKKFIILFKKNIKNCIINLSNNNLSIFNKLLYQRMIGVIYNQNNKFNSHYIQSIISKQYDLFIYISYINNLI